MVTHEEKIKLQAIKDIVLAKTGLTQKMAESKTRKRDTVFARHLCFYMMYAYKSTTVSYQDIGNFFGKDYSTVYHSIKVINDLCDIDKKVKNTVDELHQQIQAADLLHRHEVQEYSDYNKDTCAHIREENKRHKKNMDMEVERHKKVVNKLLNKIL
jgi:hypothetical protein